MVDQIANVFRRQVSHADFLPSGSNQGTPATDGFAMALSTVAYRPRVPTTPFGDLSQIPANNDVELAKKTVLRLIQGGAAAVGTVSSVTIGSLIVGATAVLSTLGLAIYEKSRGRSGNPFEVWGDAIFRQLHPGDEMSAIEPTPKFAGDRIPSNETEKESVIRRELEFLRIQQMYAIQDGDLDRAQILGLKISAHLRSNVASLEKSPSAENGNFHSEFQYSWPNIFVPIIPAGTPTSEEELELHAKVIVSGNARVQLFAEKRSKPQTTRTVATTLIVKRGDIELGRRTFRMSIALDGSRPMFVQEYWGDFFTSIGLPEDTDPSTLQFQWEFQPEDPQQGIVDRAPKSIAELPRRWTENLPESERKKINGPSIEREAPISVPVQFPRQLQLTAHVVMSGRNMRVQLIAERRSTPLETHLAKVKFTVKHGTMELGQRTFDLKLAMDGSRPVFAQEYWDEFPELVKGYEPSAIKISVDIVE